MANYDALIVGSGPAGVSAAFPLVEAGFRVCMIDPAQGVDQSPPRQSYFQMRTKDPNQWIYSLGPDFHALHPGHTATTSPKFRVPRLSFAFEGFRDAYRLTTEGAVVNGSLSSGGLSNAWGAGVACFDDTDLKNFPIKSSDLNPSYHRLSRRIGLSGTDADDLSTFFGCDCELLPPTSIDPKLRGMLRAYHRNREPAAKRGVVLGRSRHAILTLDRNGRKACKDCGQCLIGCAEGAIYNAANEVTRLRMFEKFDWLPDVFVEFVELRDGKPTAIGRRLSDGQRVTLTAKTIVLAAGAIGTAAIVLRSLNITTPVRLLSNPVAAFAVWFPRRLGSRVPERFFSLGELDFTAKWADGPNGYAFGAVFSTHGLPVAEFVSRFPVSRRASVKLCRSLLSSIAVGNCFLPGELSNHDLTLASDGSLTINGGFSSRLPQRLLDLRRQVGQTFRRYGAFMLPGAFSVGAACADMHYAGTIPMRADPKPHECDASGEVRGLPNVYVADGAALTELPAKSHTFTIMANSDRIATLIVNRLRHATP